MAIEQSCYHCTESLIPGSISTGIIQGITQSFCCPACLAIAQTIHNGGLDNYYLQRSQKANRISRYDFSLWDSPALQHDFVHQQEDNCDIFLYIEGLHCTSCAWLIEKHLSTQNGVIEATLDYQHQKLHVSVKPSSLNVSELMNAIAAIGYLPHPWQSNNIQELQQIERKNSLKQIGITAILMMQIGMFSIGIYAGDFLGISQEHRQLLSLFSLVFSLPLLYYSAMPFFLAAWFKLKNKQLNIDVSVSIAIIGLYSSSVYSVIKQTGEFYFDSIAMFCLFILIARFIEKQSRASLLINHALLPAFALKKINEELVPVPSTELSINDIILIRAGETVAIDGIVTQGSSTVSEAFLNGEPNPVPKSIGQLVYAGSINHDGELYLSVTNNLKDCYVKKLESLSQQASLEKPFEKNLTDRIALHFTRIVYVLAALTGIYWYMQGNEQAFWIALSVLVISCPCALSLAAPTALSTLQSTLRNNGVLVQSATAIDQLATITDVIFDKTGTITHGKFDIEHTITLSDINTSDCLAIASALEISSNHPIAKAFNQKGKIAMDCSIYAGAGIEGTIDNTRYRIGHVAFCSHWHNNIDEHNNNGQWIYLCSEQKMIARFLLSDRLRDNASGIVHFLHDRNIDTHLLSGDPSLCVNRIADELKIQDYHSAYSSEDKLAYIKALQENGKRCLTIGDGVNDGPILAQSDVSATLLEACDWVKNTTDILLLNNQLSGIELLFKQAVRYRMIVRQNFTWAIIYNVITIPIAMSAYVTPYWAALGMSLSSIAVVLNSRRLRKIV